jgi:hypothetical protein
MTKIASIIAAFALFSGCAATLPRVRPCKDDIVGLSSELVGWEGPPPAPGISSPGMFGAPRKVRITAHNASNRPVQFVMGCGANSNEISLTQVRLDDHEERDFYFSVVPVNGRRTFFGCHIVSFGTP